MSVKAHAKTAAYGKAETGIVEGFRELWSIFDRNERRQLLLLFALILMLAFVEMVGVSSIMPFLAVAANPALIETNPYLARAFEMLGFESREIFLIFLGSVVAGFIVLQNAFTILVKYAKARFSNMRGHAMAYRLMNTYLSKPYVFYLNQNSSELTKNVLGEVKHVIDGYLTPMLDGLTDIVVCIAVAAVLIAVNPGAAIVVALTVGLVYGLIYFGVRRWLVQLGTRRLNANKDRYKATMEAFAGIKDVKLLGKESFFLERFAKPSVRNAKANTLINVIGKTPAFVLNAVVYGGIIGAITLIMVVTDDVARYIPVIGVYVLAGSRLMPKVQNLFAMLSKMRAFQPVVELMFEQLGQSTGEQAPAPGLSAIDVTPLPFEREIRIESMSFAYPNTEEPVIPGLNLTIAKNTTVGLVGATGCGKTTTVDIVLGLLRPTSGEIYIDNTALTEDNLRAWQANLGYVPQSIYLSDDTVTRNIAFGIPDERIDHEAVRRAAEIANLGQFIENELPGAYNAQIGERGLRLSGGQRQRLGIARALYTDPSVLVMDEATSALDGMTEGAIMEAMDRLTGSKTIIIIAHRLATLKDADTIYMLDKGRIVAQGTYAGLMAGNEAFQQMARVSE